jgi:AcrR family transcriptional regulator
VSVPLPVDAPERRPGRPRDARADTAIIEAAVAVLAERGPAGFTVDAVATLAGCGKATIYRRWPSRSQLLLDAFGRIGLEPEPADTGSVADDLVLIATNLATKLRNTPTGRILPAMVAEAAVNPEMRALMTEFIRDRRRAPAQAVRRGIERGELAADTDVDLVLDVTGGVTFFRELIIGTGVDEAYLHRVVEHALAGFRPAR